MKLLLLLFGILVLCQIGASFPFREEPIGDDDQEFEDVTAPGDDAVVDGYAADYDEDYEDYADDDFGDDDYDDDFGDEDYDDDNPEKEGYGEYREDYEGEGDATDGDIVDEKEPEHELGEVEAPKEVAAVKALEGSRKRREVENDDDGEDDGDDKSLDDDDDDDDDDDEYDDKSLDDDDDDDDDDDEYDDKSLDDDDDDDDDDLDEEPKNELHKVEAPKEVAAVKSLEGSRKRRSAHHEEGHEHDEGHFDEELDGGAWGPGDHDGHDHHVPEEGEILGTPAQRYDFAGKEAFNPAFDAALI